MNIPQIASEPLPASNLFGVLARARVKMKQVASDIEQLRLILTDERRQWQMVTALELNRESVAILTIAKTIGMKTAATQKLIQAASQLRDIAERYPPNKATPDTL